MTGLAAMEGMSLLRLWLDAGGTAWRLEAVHVLAGGRRCAIGAVAAAAVTLLGAIKLPSPGVIAAVGVLAAGAVIAVASWRSTYCRSPNSCSRATGMPSPAATL